MPNILEEYLIKLSSTVDVGSFNKFQSVLTDANNQVASMTSGAVSSFVKLEGSILGTFSAVGASLITLADKTAMADQNYRLLGMRMLMSKDQARAMQMALDTLGATLDEVTYDPELHARFLDLLKRNEQLGKTLGVNFDANMKQIRGLRTEFKQFGTELTFLSMGTVSRLFEKLGYSSGDLEKRVRDLNEEFSTNLPKWADKASDFLVPVWKDFRIVMGDVKTNAEDAGLAFTNMVGVMSGDTSIQGTTFNLDKMAKALGHVADEMTKVFDLASKTFTATAQTATTFGAFGQYLAAQHEQKLNRDLASVAASHGNLEAAAFYNAKADAEQKAVDDAWNRYAQAAATANRLNTPVTNPGASAQGWKDLGVSIHNYPTVEDKNIPANIRDMLNAPAPVKFTGLSKTLDPTQLTNWINRAAAQAYIDPTLLAAVMIEESGGNPNAVNKKTGATGLMQFMPDTAKQYNLTDRTDPQASLNAGAMYLHDLLIKSHGDEALALTHYGGFVTADPKKYIGDIFSLMTGMGGTPATENPIYIQNFNVQLPPGTPDQHVQVITDKFKAMQRDNAAILGVQMGGNVY
jgi:soluble lytic murein transglycosylase-like protein